jgi:hypothetical protein
VLRNEDCNAGIFAGRQCEIRNTLNTKLVPNVSEIVALVELDLVGHRASAVLLIVGVLQVPAGLGLLDEFADNLPLSVCGLINGAPHLQVLGRVSVLVLGRSLPCDDVCASRRETKLINVVGGQSGDDVASGCVDHSHVLNRGEGKEAAIRRVFAASEVALGALESREVLVYRRSIEDTNVLGSAVCRLSARLLVDVEDDRVALTGKLSRLSHDCVIVYFPYRLEIFDKASNGWVTTAVCG